MTHGSNLAGLATFAILCALAACAPDVPPTATVDGAEQAMAERLAARGPYLRCFEGRDEPEGATRDYGGFRAGEAEAYAILERRGARPCTYTLHLVGGRAGEELTRADLPLPPGQFLRVQAQRVGELDLFVVNRLSARFTPHPDGYFETTSPADYEVLALTRRVETGAWSEPTRLATHPTSAVWFLGLEPDGEGGFVLRYGVDRYHEMLFFSALGRDDGDGIFEVRFEVDPRGGALSVEPARRVGGYETAIALDVPPEP